MDDLIILANEDKTHSAEKWHQNLQQRSVDENVLNSINGLLSTSSDSVCTLKSEDFRNSSDFDVTSSPLHQSTECVEPTRHGDTTEVNPNLSDQFKNTIVLSPNGDHISIVSTPRSDPQIINPDETPQKTVLQRCHSVYAHCDNDLATLAEKRHNRNSYGCIIGSVYDSEGGVLDGVDRFKSQDDYAQKLHDSLDLMLKDADPIDLIYDRAAHTRSGVESARRTQAQKPARQHPRETNRSIDDSHNFRDPRDKINSSLNSSQTNSRTVDYKQLNRRTWCYEDRNGGQQSAGYGLPNTSVYHAADKRNNNSNVTRCARNVAAGPRAAGDIYKPDTEPTGADVTSGGETQSDMGETHRVMRRYRTKSAQHTSSIRPRSELIESTKQYDRRVTDSSRTRTMSSCRPVSMYELNGRVNILQSAALQHQQLQQQLQAPEVDNNMVTYRRRGSTRRPRSKYATMRPLSLSSVEDTMSVLAGYSDLSRSYSCAQRTKRPLSVASPQQLQQQLLRDKTNTELSNQNDKSEMHLTSWPDCTREFISRADRQSLPQDFDSRWRAEINNKHVNINDLHHNAGTTRAFSPESSKTRWIDNVKSNTPSIQCQCKQCNCTTMVTESRTSECKTSNDVHGPVHCNTPKSAGISYHANTANTTTTCHRQKSLKSNPKRHDMASATSTPNIHVREPNLIDLSDPLDMCNDVRDNVMTSECDDPSGGSTEGRANLKAPLKHARRDVTSVSMTAAMKYTQDKREYYIV